MKKIYRKALLVAAVFSSVLASAQDINLSKKVKDNNDGTYTLTLESYVTGTTVKQAVDIVLVLDNSNSMYSGSQSYLTEDGKKRIDVLKPAVQDFLSSLYNGGDCLDYKVAIVKFQGGGRRISNYLNNLSTTKTSDLRADNLCGKWIEMNKSDVDSAIKAVGDMQGVDGSDTGTPAADGLELAYRLITDESIANDGRKKVVIFFTDGCCGTGESWNVSTGSSDDYNPQNPRSTFKAYNWGYKKNFNIPNRYYAPYVVSEANKLKPLATVFSVGTFGKFKDDTQKGDTYFYLRHISSEYSTDIHVTGNNVDNTPKEGYITDDAHPYTSGKADSYENPFVTVNDGDKALTIGANELIFDANSATALNAAFQNILTTITTAPDLNGESAVVLDAMSDKFRLPAETITDNTKIKVYTCDAASVTPTWTMEGGKEKWVALEGGKVVVNPETSVAGKIESDVVEVSGFDFKANYVGDHKDGTYGKKLIIQFDIMPEPSNPGGIDDMKTNDSKSGIYVKQDDGTYAPLKNFEEPNVYLPYIKINKAGLEPGESAAFKVTGPNGYAATVIVTKTDANDPYAILKLVYTGEYTVEELDWAWANDSDSQTVTIATTEYTDDSDNPYINVNFKKGTASEVEHDESFVENNMSVNRIVGDAK